MQQFENQILNALYLRDFDIMKVSKSFYYELNLVSLVTLGHKGPSFEPVREKSKRIISKKQH